MPSVVDDIQSLSYGHFESFIADLWARDQYQTRKQSSADSADEGIDVWATVEFPYSRRVAIQAKANGPNNPVGSPDIREYAGLYRRHDVDEVVVATSSRFTREAKSEAEKLNVKLVDGQTISEMVKVLNAGDILQNLVDASEKDSESQETENNVHPIAKPSRGDLLNILQDDAGVVVNESTLSHDMASDADAYRAAIKSLIETGYLTESDLPILGGRTRYIVAPEEKHSDNSDMNRGEEVKNGFWVEMNLRSDQKAKRLETLIEAIVTGDSNPNEVVDTDSTYRLIVDTGDERRAFESDTQTDTMVEFCEYLIQYEGLLERIDLPYTPFGERALLNNVPEHPNPDQAGKFRRLDEEVYVHTKLGSDAKKRRMRQLADLCDVGLQFKGEW